jgi:hypothetical protein
MNARWLIAISNNLGDPKSMVTHLATTTQMRIGAEERARLGIRDGVILLSVGLERPSFDDRKAAALRGGAAVNATLAFAVGFGGHHLLGVFLPERAGTTRARPTARRALR